jgi:two-component system, OmpR family, response regulator
LITIDHTLISVSELLWGDMKKPIVFLAEDDTDLRESLVELLEGDGYEAVGTASGQELLKKLKSRPADIVILDLGLPDGDGLIRMADIRKVTNAPIIILSGKGELVDKIVGLELGADDYLGKPFAMRELSARLKANLRRYQMPQSKADRIRFGNWILDRGKLQVFDENHNSAALTISEFRLLEALILHANRVLSRAQILDTVKTDDLDVLDRCVDIYVTRIRKKLKDDGHELVKTVRGAGYMFVSEHAD